MRAIAVLMVIAFHAGLPVPGGFVGVDVFFVISGYVITAMLHREWRANGRIRFGHFYLRRFKRLTPALALMIVTTMILAALVLSPLGPQQTAAATALGALLLVANFVISITTGDYFDAPAAANPLLNTWSLSVEEQFYLVFPALLAIGWILARRGRRLRAAPAIVVCLVAVVSFATAMMNANGMVGPRTAFLFGFYGPVSRAWEFAVGALLALAMTRWAPTSRALHALLSALGVALLVGSAWLISGTTPFPGPWTLLPVAGTAFLLVSGHRSDNAVTRALSRRTMVRLGDWSYSLYLWHWPLIVLAVYMWPLTNHIAIAAAAASFAPAIASYHWFEQPLRNLRALSRPRTAALVAAVIAPALAVSACVWMSAQYYWEPRFASGQVTPAHEGDLGHQARFDLMKQKYYPCTLTQLDDIYQDYMGIRRCLQSKPGDDVDFAIVGDSHAEHLFLGLAEALPDTNVLYVALHDWPSRTTPNSQSTFEQLAARPSIKAVLVNSYWSNHESLSAMVDPIAELLDHGKAVYITDDVPDFPTIGADRCKYRTGLFGPTRCSRDAADFTAEYDSYMAKLTSVTDQFPSVHLLKTARTFCSDTTCDMTYDGNLIYEDNNHLNSSGSRLIAKRILAEYPELRASLTSSG